MAKQTEIGYEAPTEYKPYQTGGTLVRASELNAMNGGIVDACAAADDLRTKRLPTYVVAQDGDTATQDVYTEDILGPCLILDLATRTTYYETGGDEEGHRKAITSGTDIDELRDSLSRVAVEGVATSAKLQAWGSSPDDVSIQNRYETPAGEIYVQVNGSGLGFFFTPTGGERQTVLFLAPK